MPQRKDSNRDLNELRGLRVSVGQHFLTSGNGATLSKGEARDENGTLIGLSTAKKRKRPATDTNEQQHQ